MSYALGRVSDPSKVFIAHKANVSTRLDPFYYRPQLVALEEQIKKVTPHRLREFVLSMAGGATPSTSESDVHYVEGDGGIPFIRVQNLSTTGKLNLEDCKHITRSTHEGLLKRSKLSGGELLVKITGVGRMAVASVVPEHFEGNINQHIVAIRTKDIETSEALAAYLNLDVAERLASRRSTGGTRPALDYPALLSIPIVLDDRIPLLMQAAVERHQRELQEAATILANTDKLLLDKLGIPGRSEEADKIENRIFHRSFSEVGGGRLDAHYHQSKFDELIQVLKKHPYSTLRDLLVLSGEQWNQKSIFAETFPYVEIGSIDLTFGKLAAPPLIPVEEAPSRATMLVRPGDMLISLTRPTRRAICIVPDDLPIAIASNGFCVVRGFKKSSIVPRFMFHVIRSQLCATQFDQRASGGNYPAITEEQLLKIIVPLPQRRKQEEITELLDAQIAKAEKLVSKAHGELQKAKQEIEDLILEKVFRDEAERYSRLLAWQLPLPARLCTYGRPPGHI